MLNYKKPTFWIIVVAAVACIVVAVCFLMGPNSNNVINPWVKEYIPGQEGIIGNVDVEMFESISADFAIGADKYGRAVFKNPNEAFKTFMELYKYAISHIRDNYLLKPISETNYDMYKVYGWQTTGGTAEEVERAAFVTKFLDIYENSFDKSVPNTENVQSTSEGLTLEKVIELSQKGEELTWADFEMYPSKDIGSGLYILRYDIDDLFYILIGGVPNVKPMYISLQVNNESQDSIEIRTEDAAEFIKAHRDDTPVSFTSNVSSVDGPNFSYTSTYAWVNYSEEGYAAMVTRSANKDLKRRYGNINHFMPLVKLDTKAEFDEFYAEMSGYFSLTEGREDLKPFSDQLALYNETAFENYSLFIAYINEPSCSIRHELEEVQIEKEVLELRICQIEPDEKDTVMAGWFMSVLVPKKQIFNCKAYDSYICATHYPDRKILTGNLIRMYSFKGEEGLLDTSVISLYDSGEFTFIFSPISSYLGYGTYEKADNRLTLRTDDGNFIYVFEVADDTLIFDGKASSGANHYSCFKDGSVFK